MRILSDKEISIRLSGFGLTFRLSQVKADFHRQASPNCTRAFCRLLNRASALLTKRRKSNEHEMDENKPFDAALSGTVFHRRR
jgi:hypothetical protein